MFLATSYTEATPGGVSDDYLVVGPDWVILLDGATAPAGVDSGCIHDVPWLVRRLAAALVRHLTLHEDSPLPQALHHAIEQAVHAHADTCDLDNPDSPSSTVAMLRRYGEQVDYLVLADSPIVLDTGDGVRAVIDDRSARLSDYSLAGVRAARNAPDGFWVASTKPIAAVHAISGSLAAGQLSRAALLTDGASRWVDRFGLGSWLDLIGAMAQRSGPAQVVAQVRNAERLESEEERSRHRGKRHDDATAVYVQFPGGEV